MRMLCEFPFTVGISAMQGATLAIEIADYEVAGRAIKIYSREHSNRHQLEYR